VQSPSGGNESFATAGAPVPLSYGPVERDMSADYINRTPTVAGISQKRIAGFI
jgi:hypothetical protein